MKHKDKLQHFGAGAIIALVVTLISGQFITPVIAAIAGFGVATVIGIAKEVWDGMGHGTKDVMDAVATSAGGAFGVGVGLLLL